MNRHRHANNRRARLDHAPKDNEYEYEYRQHSHQRQHESEYDRHQLRTERTRGTSSGDNVPSSPSSSSPYRPELAVSFVARIPQSWTEIHLADALDFQLNHGRHRNAPKAIVHCQRNTDVARENEYYIEVREQKQRKRLLELNGAVFSSGSVDIRPRVEPWVVQSHEEVQGKKSWASNEKGNGNNNNSNSNGPSRHRPPNDQSNGDYNSDENIEENRTKTRKRDTDNDNNNNNNNNNCDDGDGDGLGEKPAKRSKGKHVSTNDNENSSSNRSYSSASVSFGGRDGTTNGSRGSEQRSEILLTSDNTSSGPAPDRGTTDGSSSPNNTNTVTNTTNKNKDKSAKCEIFITRTPNRLSPESFRNYINRHLIDTNMAGDGNEPPVLDCYETTDSSSNLGGWTLTMRSEEMSNVIMTHIDRKLVVEGVRLYFQRHPNHLAKAGAATTSYHQLGLLSSPYGPSRRKRSEDVSKDKARQRPSPNWKDEHCLVFLSRKPPQMSWDEMLDFINSSIKKLALFDEDVIVGIFRYKQQSARLLCISTFAAQTIVEKLSGVKLKGTIIMFRRHRNFQVQNQRQQHIEREKNGHIPSINAEETSDSITNTAPTICSLSSRPTGSDSLSPMLRSRSATDSHTVVSKNAISDIANTTANATARSKTSTSDSGTLTTPIVSRTLFCRLATTTKPVSIDSIVSFLNKSVVNKHHANQKMIVRTEECCPLLYRLETDSEESVSKLIALSGIVYDDEIQLTLTRDQHEGNPSSLLTTQGASPAPDKGTSKNGDRWAEEDYNRMVLAKPVKGKGYSRHGEFELQAVRSLLIGQLRKYGFSKLHHGSEKSIMSCSQVKKTVVIKMATPQLAMALMNFNQIHSAPWTIFLSRHKNYKGKPSRFRDIHQFVRAYKLNQNEATAINWIDKLCSDTSENPGTESPTAAGKLVLSDKIAEAGASDTANRELVLQLQDKNEKLENRIIQLLKENKNLKKLNESAVKLENLVAAPLSQNEITPGTHDEPIELQFSDNDEDENSDNSSGAAKKMIEKVEYDEMKRRCEIALSELERSKFEFSQKEKELAMVKDACEDLEKQIDNARNIVNEDYERRIQEIHDSWREQNLQIKEQQQMVETLKLEAEGKQRNVEELTSKLLVCRERHHEMTDALTRATRLYDEEREARKELTVDVIRLKKAKKLAEKKLKCFEGLGNCEGRVSAGDKSIADSPS